MGDDATRQFDQDIVRVLPSAPTLTRAEGRQPTMAGHFSVFDTWYEVNSWFEGHFLERTKRGAFKETIREDRDRIKVTFNHGYDVLGDQVLGPIDELREDETGPYYEVPLFRGVPELLVEGLDAGVYGSSFRFRVTGDTWDEEPGESDHNPKGLPERTITKVRVMEFGPVTFPANPDATAGLRSATDDYYDSLRERSPSAYEAAVRSAKEVSTGRPDTRSAGGGGANDTAPDGQVSPDPQPPAAPEPTKETPVETTLTVEERVARQAEITARQTEIDTEHTGSELPDEVRAEWDRLETEYAQHQAAIQDAEARRAVLEARAQSPGNREEPPGPGTHTRSPRVTEDIYDLTAIRRRASSVDDLAGLYRDNAKRAVERATYPTLTGRGISRRERITREDFQRQVEYLLDFVDDEAGTLARRILVTGSPLYDRAFGKTVAAQSDMGLTSAERAALALGTGGTGGFAVPFQLDPTVLLTSNGSINPLRQISRVEQIVGKEWDGVTSTGITVSRSLEAAEATDNAPALLQPTVKAERVIGFVPFSMEIEQDWAGLRSEMTRLLSDAKDQEEATSFVTGNGTPPNPNGIITTLGVGSNVVANTFAVGNLYNLEEAVPPRFRQQSSILASKTIFNLVRQFDTAGGAALWVRLADGLPPELLGYPAYENSNMVSTLPLVIGNRYLLMGDFQQFLIVDRVGMSVELVPHLLGAANRFPTGQRGIFAIWRNNCKILFDNAFRVLHKAA